MAAGGGELDSRSAEFVGGLLDLLGRAHGQVDVFDVEPGGVELLHEFDDAGAVELAEGVAGDAEANGQRRRDRERCVECGEGELGHCRSRGKRGNAAEENAAGRVVVHSGFSAQHLT